MVKKIIAVAMLKGGTGKTTTAINLAAAFGELGNRTLLIDFDPQAHATRAFGLEPLDLQTGTVYNALDEWLRQGDTTGLRQAARHTDMKNVSIAPTSVLLAGMFESLFKDLRGAFALADLVEEIASDYDIIICDSTSSPGIMALNPLVAATDVIIPIKAEDFSFTSLPDMFATIKKARAPRVNPNLKISGILFTDVDGSYSGHRQGMEYIKQEYGATINIFERVIPHSGHVVTSQAMRRSLFQHAASSNVAQAYLAIAKLVLPESEAAQ